MIHLDTETFPAWLKPVGFFTGAGVFAWHGFDTDVINRIIAAVGAVGSFGIGAAATLNALTNARKARWAREDVIYARGLDATPAHAEPVPVGPVPPVE